MDEVPSPAESSKVERFAQLLATCQRQVFLYAMSLLHNAANAEEVLQETNLVLWRKFDQYQPGTDFGRWASSIAHYEVLKQREKKLRHERLFSDAFIESLAADAPQRAGLLEARRQALLECLTKLSQADRQLVTCRYQPEANTRQLAEAVGRSVQGTRRALHRIRTALAACVERTLAREGAA